MKIAFVSLMGGLPWGGSEALWHSIATHALKEGDEVFVSVYDWGTVHEKIKQLKEFGATIHYRQRFNPNAGTVEKIKRFVKKRQPSFDKDYQTIIDFKPAKVFISQGDSFDLAVHHRPLYELLSKNRIAYSMVCHSHVQYGWIPPLEIFPAAVTIFENASHVFFVSKRQRQITERRLITKLSNAKTTWNPVNITFSDAALPWPETDCLQMAIVGQLSGSKGQDTAIEVLGSGEWKNRDWLLNLYGEGEGKDYLQALVLFYAIEDKVKFHGHVKDIKSAWLHNQLLLIPSSGEGMPTNLLEAMACGRPAVVTDVGGNTELIEEDKTGFIAVSPTTEAFASALEMAWNKKNTLKMLGVNAFEKISSLLDKEPEKRIYNLLNQFDV